MHVAKRNAKMGTESRRRKGMVGKVVVMGLLERHTGRFDYRMIDNNKLTTLDTTVRQAVASGSNLYTDALGSYRKLDDEYIHNVIDHADKYVKGEAHTYGSGNFW